jgi:hypothetical protein
MGLHLTQEAAHVPGRDEEGWKLSDTAWIAFVQERLADDSLTESEAEAALKGATRFCRACFD